MICPILLLAAVAAGSTSEPIPTRTDAAPALPSLWADVRAFGAKGDGQADDTAAFRAALKSAASVILVPPGRFKITSGISVPGGKCLRGSGSATSKLHFYQDDATAIEAAGEVSGFELVSMGKNQSGIFVTGTHPVVQQVGLSEFQDVALRLGRAGRVGAYFADISSITVLNKTSQGRTGVLVDGGVAPSSNANVLRNIFVKGRWTTLVDLKGHDNSWIGGDTEWDPTGEGVEDVWLIEGTGNAIHGPYLEGARGPPRRIFRFTEAASGNVAREIYGQFLIENYTARVEDRGYANELEVLPRAKFLPFAAETVSSANLLPNASFKNWVQGAPVGWSVKSGSFTRTRDTRGGAAYGLKATAINNNPAIACAVAGRGASKAGVTIGRLQGKTVTAGVWLRSTERGMGAIKISVDGGGGGFFGRDSHSGDGTWQFLTAFAKVPSDATSVSVELRAFGSGTGSGELLFSDPVMVEGAHLPQPSPALLGDGYAKMAGPFAYNTPMEFEPGDRTPSVQDGNVFKTANVQPTTISGFREGIPGQAITVIFGDARTTIDFATSSLRGHGGAPWSASSGDHMSCVFDGTYWYCSVSENGGGTRGSGRSPP
jgi:hypothetical protein